MADKTATYSIRADSNAKSVGDEGADALAKLKAQIEASQAAMRDMNASLRSLKGSSEEVAAAKKQLGAAVDAEKSAISAASLALLKQGSSYTKLADEAKKAEAEAKKLAALQEKTQAKHEAKALEEAKKKADAAKAAFEASNKPIVDMKSASEALKTSLGGMAGPIGAVVAAVGAVAAAFVAAGLAAAGLAAAVGHWIVTTADAVRSARLEREAWLGSEQQALALGHQIDALRGKVPTTTAELQKLALETNKAFAQSYLSGQGIVDTFNTIGVASAAMGDQVGNQLGDLIKRAKDFGRVQIQPLDLRGTTISLRDVATQLAAITKTSVAQAEANLRAGGVKIDQAAAALRATVEKRFGAINTKKMLSLDALKSQLSDVMRGLTKDVNIEPLLEGISKLVGLFDQSNVSGHALKQLIDSVSKQLGPAFAALAPIAKEAFVRIEIQAYRLINAALDVRDRWRETFKGTALEAITTADAIKVVNGVLTAIGTAGVSQVHIVGNAFIRLASLVLHVKTAIETVSATLGSWKDAGSKLVEGLISGITEGIDKLKETIKKLADGAKKVFQETMQIHSPSLVFAKYGEQIDEGAIRGIDHGAPDVQNAVEAMAPSPPAGGSSPRGGAIAGATSSGPISIHFYVDARGAAPGVAERLQSAEFETAIGAALDAVLKNLGLAPQKGVTA